jgi:hypothetical protein
MREKLKGLIDNLCAELKTYIQARSTKIISQIPPEIPVLKTVETIKKNSKGEEVKSYHTEIDTTSPVLSKQGRFLKEAVLFYKPTGKKEYIQHQYAYYVSDHGNATLTLERIKNILMAMDELTLLKNGIMNNGFLDIEKTVHSIQNVLLRYNDNNKEISAHHGKTHTSFRESHIVYGFFSSVLRRTICQSKAMGTFEACDDLIAIFKTKHLNFEAGTSRTIGSPEETPPRYLELPTPSAPCAV